MTRATSRPRSRWGLVGPPLGTAAVSRALRSFETAPRRAAVLFDAAWTNERGMTGALLKYTKRIVARPSDYEMPGWVSVDAAIGFLKGLAGDKPGLRGFLLSACAAFLSACLPLTVFRMKRGRSSCLCSMPVGGLRNVPADRGLCLDENLPDVRSQCLLARSIPPKKNYSPAQSPFDFRQIIFIFAKELGFPGFARDP